MLTETAKTSNVAKMPGRAKTSDAAKASSIAKTSDGAKASNTAKANEAAERPGKALLEECYNESRKRKLIIGLTFFAASAALVIAVSLRWRGGIDWLYCALLTVTGLYGFLNMTAGVKMTEFDTSPIGRFIVGEHKKFAPEVILIKKSEDSKKYDGRKYKAVISFLDNAGARTSVTVYGYESSRSVIGYLKERLSGRCVIMDLTVLEFKAKRKEYGRSKRASKRREGGGDAA